MRLQNFSKSCNLKFKRNWNNESKCLARTDTITNLLLPLAESAIVQADGVLHGGVLGGSLAVRSSSNNWFTPFGDGNRVIRKCDPK